MVRSDVDPVCGHLWSRHRDGIICPADLRNEDDYEYGLRQRGRTRPDPDRSGPVEGSEDDDAADWEGGVSGFLSPEEHDFTIKHLPREPVED